MFVVVVVVVVVEVENNSDSNVIQALVVEKEVLLAAFFIENKFNKININLKMIKIKKMNENKNLKSVVLYHLK